MKQVRAKLSRGSYSIEAYVQIQKDAPVELLLGTDLQSQLGFLFLDVVDQKHPLNLLETKAIDDCNRDHDETPTQGQVCLLQAVKIPTRHAQKVHVQVQQSSLIDQEYALFQPTDHLAQITGLVIEEALVPMRDITTLVIANPGMHPIRLEEGQYIGNVSMVELTQEIDTDVPVSACGGSVSGVISEVSPSSNRQHHLLTMLNQEQWNADEATRHQLQSLVLEYEDVFAVDDSELGRAQDVTHSIDTGDQHPIRQHPRRIPFALRGQVEEMVEKMLQQGVIKQSKSPWGSPIVLVAKKDGTTRFCVDYRKLNSVTKKDVYPLPRIDDTLDTLAHNKFFSTLDLASGYWQIAMEESSQEKTTFTMHIDLYEFVVMPFGLCNAPATFQRLMESILHGLIGRSCMVYLNDVLVLGKTVEEHISNLRKVWSRLRGAGLRLKPSKCNLFKMKSITWVSSFLQEESLQIPRRLLPSNPFHSHQI